MTDSLEGDFVVCSWCSVQPVWWLCNNNIIQPQTSDNRYKYIGYFHTISVAFVGIVRR